MSAPVHCIGGKSGRRSGKMSADSHGRLGGSGRGKMNSSHMNCIRSVVTAVVKSVAKAK